jgi:hypothetical protein
MTSATRRAFLFGLGAASLVASPKLIMSRLPLLYGDGVHDDAEALNALFAGKPIKLAETGDTFRPFFSSTSERIALRGGRYRISAPILFDRSGLRVQRRARHHGRWLGLRHGVPRRGLHADNITIVAPARARCTSPTANAFQFSSL